MTKRKSGVDEEMEWAGGQEEDKISQLHFGSLVRRTAGLPRRPHLTCGCAGIAFAHDLEHIYAIDSLPK